MWLERERENGEKDFGNITIMTSVRLKSCAFNAKSQTWKTSQMNKLKGIKEIVVGIKS